MNNKYALLNIKVKYGYIVFAFLLLFLLILLSSIYYKTYDSYRTTGTYNNKILSITIPSDDVAKIISSDFLEIKNKKYKFSILSVSEAEYLFELDNVYQTLEIQLSSSFYDNEILDVTFYRNRQRIIKKILKLLK